MRRSNGDFSGAVVVITGASSGIGRATAELFADAGATLVLAARRIEALREVAADCTTRGIRALAIKTDVTDPGALQTLAQAALHAYGRIDVWINNAGTGLFGAFLNGDIALHRRVIEINLFGAMYGAAAVLPIFRRQQRGVLINNISIGAFTPVPFAAAYTASKFGLRGFTAALRQEWADYPGIRICSVFPASVDTPGYHHGANVSGRILKPAPPLFSPQTVAEAIARTAANPRDEVSVGWPSAVAKTSYGLAPLLTERTAGHVMRRYLKNAAPSPYREGNLIKPVTTGTGATGGWSERTKPERPNGIPTVLGVVAAGGAALLLLKAIARTRNTANV